MSKCLILILVCSIPLIVSDIVTDSIPVCTLSPIFSSAILTDFPLSRLTTEDEGKQSFSLHFHPKSTHPPQQPQGGQVAYTILVVVLGPYKSNVKYHNGELDLYGLILLKGLFTQKEKSKLLH